MNLEKFFFKKISLWTLILTIIFGIICIIWFGSLVLKSRTALKIAQIPQNLKTIIKKNLYQITMEISDDKCQICTETFTAHKRKQKREPMPSRNGVEQSHSPLERGRRNTHPHTYTYYNH